jgi:hypothetical protein
MHLVQTKEAIRSHRLQVANWIMAIRARHAAYQSIEITKKNGRRSRGARINGFLTIR